MPVFLRTHLTALRMLLVMTVILGIAYPLLVTGISQLAFPARANGSLVKSDGRPVGSGLIGQTFDLPKADGAAPDAPAQPDPKWFQPRPSAGGYDPTASGASNLGPNSADLLKAVEERRAAVAAFDGVDPATVPPDALTASGSGLDPHISVAYAREQVNRVARERSIPAEQLNRLVDQHTDGRSLGFLGQGGVNVLRLNQAVADLK
ncbi:MULTISPECIES: potassium-transporting ATPase subunit KdpC [Kitasatospora]|uniref:Potassium-transporting ATPase KdpC subunit n=1 Tax=Kitasatospora setae (strain ATCC 33774 / DSM 43861 / JCM 3304 / KCC A-0304 / NBRC 14216 / KM-6054) TaxID=452652 RepID=E4NDZ5_KITSK|nr:MULTISPECIES: potassium-transporting ATPase subunit KdpC [Kitasatospora]BAJ29426.1 putative high-affinity potassium transport system [Kitasatospora setae KM-6054]